MKPLYWTVLLAVAVIIVGVVFGVAGLFIAPILGGLAIIALIIWLIERKAQHKPPVE